MVMRMEAFIRSVKNEMITRAILTSDLYDAIVQSKLLIVGAGGIGCELLKDLVLSGFSHLHILDLDTVDTTNLNRQFLFRKRHVGLSKAEVAKEAVLLFRPNANIITHHGNIMDPQYSTDFIQQFDLVLNALDNNEARRYVNKMCVSLDIPLVDSGSTGYNGQVMPIIRGITRCFECHPLPRQKGYPVCTIRSTPSRSEHCIAWAKYLFELLFGAEDESNLLSDLKSGLGRDGIVLRDEGKVDEKYMKEFGKRVFEFAFDKEIQKQAEMKEAWEGKIPPRPLATDDYEKINELSVNSTANCIKPKLPKQQIWPLDKTIRIFYQSIQEMFTERYSIIGNATFDKDDDIAMNFVTSAANLRMWNFHIDLISRWDAESIAGAIIPAIASTNAIVSGMQVIQALHVLKWLAKKKLKKKNDQEGQKEEPKVTTELLAKEGIKHVWVKENPLGPFILLPEELEPPSKMCSVCQPETIIIKLHNFKEWSLSLFIDEILKKTLGSTNPQLGNKERILYDPELEEYDDDDDDDDEEFKKQNMLSLVQWGLTSGTLLYLIDAVQGIECDIILRESPEVASKTSPDLPSTLFSIDKRPTKKEKISPTQDRMEESRDFGKRSREEMEGTSSSTITEMRNVDSFSNLTYKSTGKRRKLDKTTSVTPSSVQANRLNLIEIDSDEEISDTIKSVQEEENIDVQWVDLS